MDLSTAFALTELSWQELVLRVGLAMLFGFLLGIDRDVKNKPVGFRVYMIVAITTCTVAIMGHELNAQYLANADANANLTNLDVGKIISGTLTGIGFLGAGAILHKGDEYIVGAATGASIWAAGGIGLAIGFGLYLLASVAFFAIAIILFGGGFISNKLRDRKKEETYFE